jgi:ubiquitin-protein ligase
MTDLKSMRRSPRDRRLAADYQALVRLGSESSIFTFAQTGSPPEVYDVTFRGAGLWQMGDGRVVPREEHRVHIELGSAYPRMMPALYWRTPIFHPNISSGGVVCLGGYSTSWVPSLTLDQLCAMLWDMIRYRNFDIESPYNREAALWARDQTTLQLPLDPRDLRDRISGEAPPIVEAEVIEVPTPPVLGRRDAGGPPVHSFTPSEPRRPVQPEIHFIG